MTRIICVIVLSLAATVVHAADQSKDSRPNIVLIMADDVGYECFGAYGSKQYKTPHLDQMAAKGIRFDHCYAQPLCTPSRTKLMTGLSNVRNYAAFSVLNRDQTTFGHLLQRAGYRTAVAGKWQLYGSEQYETRFRGKGTLPGDAGFDQWCLWQVDRRGERYWAPLMNVDGVNKQYPDDAYGPDVAAQYLMDFMAQKSDKPFFAYYPMILVHDPFTATPDSKNRKSKDQQQNFEDMVAYADKLVGKLIRKAEELGIADNTLFLFTGDNGTHHKIKSQLDGKPISGDKGAMTDAGTRAPMIGYWPGVIKAGRVSSDLVDFSDFLPTLLDVAKAPAAKMTDGHSFLPQLRGEAGNPREWIYMFYHPRPEKGTASRFARDQRWKLYGDGRFYDIASDPSETKVAPIVPGSEAAKAHEKLSKALESMPSQGQSLLKFTDSK